jgi:glycerol-3-phosphate acyltransferase PlsY
VAPAVTLLLIGIFAAVVAPSRIVSLASIAAAMAAPVIFWLFDRPPMLIGMAGFIALMITWRHRSNIRRLLSGTEPKFGSASSR